jgi:hypothetical protein
VLIVIICYTSKYQPHGRRIKLTKLKEQALDIIRNVPDDKMAVIIDILKGLSGLDGNSYETFSTKKEAWDDFKKYKGIIKHDIDEKAELARARDEKYAGSI